MPPPYNQAPMPPSYNQAPPPPFQPQQGNPQPQFPQTAAPSFPPQQQFAPQAQPQQAAVPFPQQFPTPPFPQAAAPFPQPFPTPQPQQFNQPQPWSPPPQAQVNQQPQFQQAAAPPFLSPQQPFHTPQPQPQPQFQQAAAPSFPPQQPFAPPQQPKSPSLQQAQPSPANRPPAPSKAAPTQGNTKKEEEEKKKEEKNAEDYKKASEQTGNTLQATIERMLNQSFEKAGQAWRDAVGGRISKAYNFIKEKLEQRRTLKQLSPNTKQPPPPNKQPPPQAATTPPLQPPPPSAPQQFQQGYPQPQFPQTAAPFQPQQVNPQPWQPPLQQQPQQFYPQPQFPQTAAPFQPQQVNPQPWQPPLQQPPQQGNQQPQPQQFNPQAQLPQAAASQFPQNAPPSQPLTPEEELSRLEDEALGMAQKLSGLKEEVKHRDTWTNDVLQEKLTEIQQLAKQLDDLDQRKWDIIDGLRGTLVDFSPVEPDMTPTPEPLENDETKKILEAETPHATNVQGAQQEQTIVPELAIEPEIRRELEVPQPTPPIAQDHEGTVAGLAETHGSPQLEPLQPLTPQEELLRLDEEAPGYEQQEQTIVPKLAIEPPIRYDLEERVLPPTPPTENNPVEPPNSGELQAVVPEFPPTGPTEDPLRGEYEQSFASAIKTREEIHDILSREQPVEPSSPVTDQKEGLDNDAQPFLDSEIPVETNVETIPEPPDRLTGLTESLDDEQQEQTIVPEPAIEPEIRRDLEVPTPPTIESLEEQNLDINKPENNPVGPPNSVTQQIEAPTMTPTPKPLEEGEAKRHIEADTLHTTSVEPVPTPSDTSTDLTTPNSGAQQEQTIVPELAIEPEIRRDLEVPTPPTIESLEEQNLDINKPENNPVEPPNSGEQQIVVPKPPTPEPLEGREEKKVLEAAATLPHENVDASVTTNIQPQPTPPTTESAAEELSRLDNEALVIARQLSSLNDKLYNSPMPSGRSTWHDDELQATLTEIRQLVDQLNAIDQRREYLEDKLNGLNPDEPQTEALDIHHPTTEQVKATPPQKIPDENAIASVTTGIQPPPSPIDKPLSENNSVGPPNSVTQQIEAPTMTPTPEPPEKDEAKKRFEADTLHTTSVEPVPTPSDTSTDLTTPNSGAQQEKTIVPKLAPEPPIRYDLEDRVPPPTPPNENNPVKPPNSGEQQAVVPEFPPTGPTEGPSDKEGLQAQQKTLAATEDPHTALSKEDLEKKFQELGEQAMSIQKALFSMNAQDPLRGEYEQSFASAIKTREEIHDILNREQPVEPSSPVTDQKEGLDNEAKQILESETPDATNVEPIPALPNGPTGLTDSRGDEQPTSATQATVPPATTMSQVEQTTDTTRSQQNAQAMTQGAAQETGDEKQDEKTASVVEVENDSFTSASSASSEPSNASITSLGNDSIDAAPPNTNMHKVPDTEQGSKMPQNSENSFAQPTTDPFLKRLMDENKETYDQIAEENNTPSTKDTSTGNSLGDTMEQSGSQRMMMMAAGGGAAP